MKLKTFVSVLILLVFTKFANAQSFPTNSTTQPIIPSPEVYKLAAGQLMLSDNVSICSKDLPENIKTYLIEKFNQVYELRTTVSTVSKDIVFKKIVNVPKDWYSINVNETVTITYSSDESCFYAVVSLLQMIEGDNGALYIQKCFVQDAPNFQWRGLHLDVARHFYNVDEVKRFIDLMALYKFNTFHWHLTDDQGWRIEIKKYPLLTSISSIRKESMVGAYKDMKFDKTPYGGFYTQNDIKEVVAYASKKFVTIIPEIEMPGHSQALLAAYPQLGCNPDKIYEVATKWGVSEDVLCPREETFTVMQDILTEVMALFPGQYIHIGGDECPKKQWKESRFCQDLIKKLKLKDEHELQSYFIGRIDKFITSKGKKMLGWDEILEGGLSPNAMVMSWRGTAGGIEAAKLNHDVVMSPNNFFYLDYYQADPKTQPLAIGGNLPLSKCYSFEPDLPELTEAEAKHIVGVQANLWTEYIGTPAYAEYMTFPRALALAEIGWSPKRPKNYVAFSDRVKKHIPVMDALKINYCNVDLK
jgi:hexosaminidase